MARTIQYPPEAGEKRLLFHSKVFLAIEYEFFFQHLLLMVSQHLNALTLITLKRFKKRSEGLKNVMEILISAYVAF